MKLKPFFTDPLHNHICKLIPALLAGRITTVMIPRPAAVGGEISPCPYEAGDIIFVQEPWKVVGWDYDDSEAKIQYQDEQKETHFVPDDGKSYDWLDKHIWELEGKGILKAIFGTEEDAESDDLRFEFTGADHPCFPKEDLPEWACRVYLEVNEIHPFLLRSVPSLASINAVERIETGGFKDYEIIHEGPHKGEDSPFSFFPNKYSLHSLISLYQTMYGPIKTEDNPGIWLIDIKPISKPETLQ